MVLFFSQEIPDHVVNGVSLWYNSRISDKSVITGNARDGIHCERKNV